MGLVDGRSDALLGCIDGRATREESHVHSNRFEGLARNIATLAGSPNLRPRVRAQVPDLEPPIRLVVDYDAFPTFDLDLC